MAFMESKNPTKIECQSLQVCAYVHIFLRKDSKLLYDSQMDLEDTKITEQVAYREKGNKGRQKHPVQSCLAFADRTS